MKNKLITLSLFALTSCITNKPVFQDQNFNEFEKLRVNTVIKSERKKRSKDITPDHLIGIGEGIYPNKNNFILATPKTYEIRERLRLRRETEYFYSVADSSVKVILYQWDYLTKSQQDRFGKENFSKKFKTFQNKFDDLVTELIKELGEASEKNVEQSKIIDETFRDDLKWRNKNGLNAYLFMFGNNNNGYRQIRLAIYKD